MSNQRERQIFFTLFNSDSQDKSLLLSTSSLLDVTQFFLCPDWPACSCASPAGVALAPSYWAAAVSGAPAHCLGSTGKSGSFQSAPSAGSPLSVSPLALENPYGIYGRTQGLDTICICTLCHCHMSWCLLHLFNIVCNCKCCRNFLWNTVLCSCIFSKSKFRREYYLYQILHKYCQLKLKQMLSKSKIFYRHFVRWDNWQCWHRKDE